MLNEQDLYSKYDLLLPSRFEGGYLIILLYQRIADGEIPEFFEASDIRTLLDEIAKEYQESSPQSERIIKRLIHYHIRSHFERPGKYFLTEFSKSTVNMLIHKLENPYKKFQLKSTFEEHFSLRLLGVRTVADLESRFGRIFIEGPKKVVNDHLQALEDELDQAYSELNTILEADLSTATEQVRLFSGVFRKFGNRADDIGNSISSKDKFLRDLLSLLDGIYAAIQSSAQPKGDEEVKHLLGLKQDYLLAKEIYQDLLHFFDMVDIKLGYIGRQILNASEKLSELHENLSSRAHFRLKLKLLFKNCLDSSQYSTEGVTFLNGFPLKSIALERLKLVHPVYYDYVHIPINLTPFRQF
ncbi:hypothetical protein [Pedobacter jejuensis]|uniref:DUF3375 domain-containing protein n=1 Tax=Pedobacter jejuensis TaxID=1268550 RepID=A0A3N0BUS4_9SPHI|nr:hypothetical protein [Pedobacter jejuensis]RNL53144.1 hypothetical protein D7004_10585 [Pedobacter jejuensis]